LYNVPADLLEKFSSFLEQKRVSSKEASFFLKWLRYFLDFCLKYRCHQTEKSTLDRFLKKLREKRQTAAQVEQASRTIRLYQEWISLTNAGERHDRSPFPQRTASAASAAKDVNSAGKMRDFPPTRIFPKKDSPLSSAKAPIGEKMGSGTESGFSWFKEFDGLTKEIQIRHYSPKTSRNYVFWLRKFQAFTRSKLPGSLSIEDVKRFLTFLAVKEQVSASTQNQAFNALLFFFRHILGKEFGNVDGVVRAKRKPHIPVVLSREEIESVLEKLPEPYDLAVKFMYGCGLRLFECLQLRIHCFNFSAGVLTVHDGKGKKDRTVPLPETIIPQIKQHIKNLHELHRQDMAAEFSGVFLPGSLGKKYPKAAREFSWQWVFPAIHLTRVPETGELRRFHIHETIVQRAIKEAVELSGIFKRASAHTFRHSFASHLLQANYDIRTIQELLGHSDVRTTMIYTHTVKSVTKKEAKSPLDF
jgi:integron integrase